MKTGKQKKRLWILVFSLCVAVMSCGIWMIQKPHSTEQFTDSLQDILIDHIKFLPEIYSTHENYSVQLHTDTSAALIYRYSTNGCDMCYLDDLSELKRFRKTIGKDIALVLPSYSTNDRNSRIRMDSETSGFKYQNIPPDSLALPFSNGENKRYFAVIDGQGRVEMVFFPTRGRQDLTRKYFQSIAHYFQ